MCLVTWDGLNKGTMLLPSDNVRVVGGQRHRWVKFGTMTAYVNLNEMDLLINFLVDCQAEEMKLGHWPPPEPNR